MSAASIVVATFVSVLLAEIVGDRSMIAVASLAARFRARSVFAGVSAAYALKMLAAVLLAEAIARVAPSTLAAISCVTWLFTAWAIWRREDDSHPRTSASPHPSVLAFASIAFTEWADPGQLTAAVLAAHFRAPLLVWCAATSALVTKSAAALLLGSTARQYLNAMWLRVATAAFCVINAAASIVAVARR